MNEELLPAEFNRDTTAFESVELIAHAILSRKGENVTVLDLHGLSDVADYFVIATAGSEPQVSAVAGAVMKDMLEKGQKPLHVEGREGNRWVLLDFVDVVVHVMLPRVRDYYKIERLWNDAPLLDIEATYFADSEVAGRHPELMLVRRFADEEPESETNES